MIPVSTKSGKSIALFGLGGSGLITAQALVEGGASLTAFDDNPKQVEHAKGLGIPVGDLREVDFSEFDALVLAPGVPLTHPEPHWSAKLANEHNVPIIGDVGLFADERRASNADAPFIAITGTNGKSTTTALISHIIASSGRNVQMGGNIGRAVLSLDMPAQDTYHVVECSSYQIDLAPNLNPSIGILLNLAPDHLDRHGTMENYASVKSRLVEGSDVAIIGVDDGYTRAIANTLKRDGGRRVFEISSHSKVANGVFVENETIYFSKDDVAEEVASLKGIATLRGVHNAQNAAAAWAVCHLSGLSDAEIQNGLRTFPGLAHRMEILGSVGGVVFVNDSKATNADAAAMALGSFDKIYWIAGGLPKEGGIEALSPYFDRISKAYLIGEAAPMFAATLGELVPFEISKTIDNAVGSAFKDAGNETSAAILLSPASASFDQYANFEVRGEAFRQVVVNLPNFEPYGVKSDV